MHCVGRQLRIVGRRGQERLHAGLRRIRRPEVERLLVDVGDALVAVRASGMPAPPRRGRTPSTPSPIPASACARRRTAVRGCGRGRTASNRAGPRDRRLAGHEVLHGLLGLDPRPAACRTSPARRPARSAGPAARPRDTACRNSSRHGGLMNSHRPARDADVHLHEDRPADARPLHRLQVRRDPLAGQVAVHDEPIHPGPGRVGRREEGRGQLIRSRRGRPANSTPEKTSTPASLIRMERLPSEWFLFPGRGPYCRR